MVGKNLNIDRFIDFLELSGYTSIPELQVQMDLFLVHRDKINKEKTLQKSRELQKKNKYKYKKRITNPDSFNVYKDMVLIKHFDNVEFSEVTKWIAEEHHPFSFQEFRNLFRNKIHTKYREANLEKYHGIEIERIKNELKGNNE